MDNENNVRFFRADLYSIFSSADENRLPYATCLVAIDGSKPSERCILKVERFDARRGKYDGSEPECGEVCYDDNGVYVREELSGEQAKECQSLYDDLQERKKSAPYHIVGYKYGDCVLYYHDSLDEHQKATPQYNVTKVCIFKDEDIPKNIEEAKKWLLTKHGDFFIGAEIMQAIPHGAYCKLPSVAEYEQKYMTKDRQLILDRIRKDMHLDVSQDILMFNDIYAHQDLPQTKEQADAMLPELQSDVQKYMGLNSYALDDSQMKQLRSVLRQRICADIGLQDYSVNTVVFDDQIKTSLRSGDLKFITDYFDRRQSDIKMKQTEEHSVTVSHDERVEQAQAVSDKVQTPVNEEQNSIDKG